MKTNRCSTCGRQLDNPQDMPASADCGGDCRRCVAEASFDPVEWANMGWPFDDEGEPDAAQIPPEAGR